MSADAVPNVLRMFSDRPYGAFWKSGLRFEDLHHLYLGEGELPESCRQLITSVSNCFLRNRFIEGRDDDYLPISSEVEMAAVLRAGEPYITGIS